MLLQILGLLTILVSIICFVKTHGVEITDFIRCMILAQKLPTLPGKRFFIGHLGIIWGLPKAAIWAKLREWAHTAPSLYTLHLGPFVAWHLTIDADVVKACISTLSNLRKASPYRFGQQHLENGLLISTGNYWQVRRKLLNPAFHNSILQQFVDILSKETSNMVKEIEKQHLDNVTDITQLISTLALSNMAETSMGTPLDTKSQAGLRYIKALDHIGNLLYQRATMPLFHPQWIFDIFPLGRKAKSLVKSLHIFTNNIIRKREENFKLTVEDDDNDSSKKKYPMLDILLTAKIRDGSIDEKGIREEVNTFMFEGYETTAWALTFAIMLLACHREIQDQIYEEIIHVLGNDDIKKLTYANLQEMTFVERCIKESLRLYPSVPIIGRKLSSDVETKYGLIPKGAEVGIHIYDLHRNKQYWTDPDKFDPSRFLPENCRNRHPFAYLPFSAGPRNCIGQKFAMIEMKTAVSGLIKNFILEPVDTPETLEMCQDILLKTTNGIRVKFVPRK